MSKGFRLLRGNYLKDSALLADMHILRHQIFKEELGWTVGLQEILGMEFDEYDRPDTIYIVHLNEKGRVDAACRLISTLRPYMIADHYKEFVTKIALPKTNKVWEISRFCASSSARILSNGKISGQLIAAAIEFGIVNGIQNYIALATDTILPVIRRYSGWDPTPVGEKNKTPDDDAYSVLYTVNHEILKKIRQKNFIETFLLFEETTHTINQTKGEIMTEENNFNIIRIPQQLHDIDASHFEEMERTLSYLEAISFAKDYQSILSGLRVIRLIINCEKNTGEQAISACSHALETLDNLSLLLKSAIGEK